MKRSPMKPRTSWIKPRSAKVRATYAGDGGLEGRRDFVARILAARERCEACVAIGVHTRAQGRDPRGVTRWTHCGGAAVDVHELVMRSAGGSIVDDANVLAVCRRGHAWIHSHPKEARQLGLLLSRYPGRRPTTTTKEDP